MNLFRHGLKSERQIIISKIFEAYIKKHNKNPIAWLFHSWELMPIHRLKIELEKYEA